jgi:hypothetical protein
MGEDPVCSALDDALLDAHHDWLNLAQFVSIGVERALIHPRDARTLAVGIAAELLFGGYAIAGDVTSDGFVRWEATPQEAFERVVTAWLHDGFPRPTPGQYAWFDITDKGRERLTSFLQRGNEEPDQER